MTPDRLDAIREAEPLLIRYNYFLMARQIGIVFGPKDITFQEMLAFHEINSVMVETKAGTDGQ